MKSRLDKTKCFIESDIPIYHISYPTKYLLNASIIRIEELYDRGDVDYSYEELMDLVATKYGAFTYFEDYNGFLLSDDYFKTFYKKTSRKLSKKEKYLKDILENEFELNLHFNSKDEFYVMFTHQDDPEIESTINHEMCHALYYCDSEYEKAANELINKIPKPTLRQINKILKKMEYDKYTITTEINSFLSTSQYSWMESKFKFDNYREISNKFRSLFKNFAKKHNVLVRKLPSPAIVKSRKNRVLKNKMKI